MTAATLGNLLAGVTALTLEERRQLRDAIDRTLNPASLEEEVERALLSAGLLSVLPPELDPASVYRECDLIVVNGRPMSETIVEDRR